MARCARHAIHYSRSRWLSGNPKPFENPPGLPGKPQHLPLPPLRFRIDPLGEGYRVSEFIRELCTCREISFQIFFKAEYSTFFSFFPAFFPHLLKFRQIPWKLRRNARKLHEICIKNANFERILETFKIDVEQFFRSNFSSYQSSAYRSVAS